MVRCPMTFDWAVACSSVAIVIAAILHPSWSLFIGAVILPSIWTAYLLSLSKILQKWMWAEEMRKLDEKDDKKQRVPDTDPMIGAIDEDLFLWHTVWDHDDN